MALVPYKKKKIKTISKNRGTQIGKFISKCQ